MAMNFFVETGVDKHAWRGFAPGRWQQTIDVRDFIQRNYRPYDGDEKFLAGPTERTNKIMARVNELLKEEQVKGGVLDIDTKTVSTPLTFQPGYIDKDNELIFGLQTDSPLKRGINPFGGIRMARDACKAYDYKLGKEIEEAFRYRCTHNDGVFRVYTDDMRNARRNSLITGLPDAYGRGRIVGDYRRLALYGADYLIEQKVKDRSELGEHVMDDQTIRLAEELWEQADALQKLKEMAWMYHVNISGPATNAREAIQWVYLAYLAAIKESNGAATSLGRVSTFIDIYIQRDLDEGTLTESAAQELVDDFIIKIRMARQLRTPEYNELFAGDPMWITEAIGGIGHDGRHMVTRTSYRLLHTLYNLGPAPEPNMTILWSARLPEPFKQYCAKVSIETDSIQYESDDLMRPNFGDDYSIACCVSAMELGKQMQYFGARCNMPKLLLLAINGGRDEISGELVGPTMEPLPGDILDFDEVMRRLRFYRDWLCQLYVNTMNVIHFMHDKYAYERTQMAFHDSQPQRLMAFGIAGLSVTADSLSAIKYASVRPVRGEGGVVVDFEIIGDFPKFGNDDPRVDSIAVSLVEDFLACLKRNPTYRDAKHTLSILTITSNVVYGLKTGNTPDGRKKGRPFAPGANPMHNRDKMGALASLNSVAKIPYECCQDGISYTFTVTPPTIGQSMGQQQVNLVHILDGYFAQGGHHLNINVLNRSQLVDAMDNPEKYPHLTIRVSGYAVNFNKLNRQQQQEVIDRTFHERL